MTITFDADTHTYRDASGRRVPSVTQILGSAEPWKSRFDDIPADTLEYKRQLGSAAHHATALDDLGLLDEDSLDEALVPYVDAWRRFRAETGFVPMDGCIERIVCHETYRYAGCLDRIGTIRSEKWLVDIKSGTAHDGYLAGPQTAAYREAAGRMGVIPPGSFVKRCSVHLANDGTYKVVAHDNRRDWNVFLAALELWSFSQGRK